MPPMLMGLETEYGFTVLGAAADEGARVQAAKDLLQMVRAVVPGLPKDAEQDVYLANGGRFYIDSGLHPEWCTPEVDNPSDAVRYMIAGDLLLGRLADEWTRANAPAEAFLFKCNVDYNYSMGATTWACHENYLYSTEPAVMAVQLIPHLVSRIIYTGAGGLNPFSQGIQFCLSPRAYFIAEVASPTSTRERGIFHMKEERLAQPGWRRLHVVFSDNLCSHKAAFLKVGATALIVTLVDVGLRPASEIQLRDPLEAVRTFNEDLSFKKSVPLGNGRLVTALDIQWHYLQFVRAHLDHPALPEWAPEVCSLWEAMLQKLAYGPAGVALDLDWAIKYWLYEQCLQERGQTWTELQGFSDAIAKWRASKPVTQPRKMRRGRAALLAQLLEILNTHHENMEMRADAPFPPMLSKTEYNNLQRLRAELCEIDIRFGQLGGRGLFPALCSSGFLKHEMPGLTPESVERAIYDPPARGRGKIRGECIRALAATGGAYQCDWTAIRDPAGRWLNLSDPTLNSMPSWTPISSD